MDSSLKDAPDATHKATNLWLRLWVMDGSLKDAPNTTTKVPTYGFAEPRRQLTQGLVALAAAVVLAMLRKSLDHWVSQVWTTRMITQNSRNYMAAKGPKGATSHRARRIG